MEDENIRQLVKKAVDNLVQRDSHLLINDLSEQSITHKIGEYLQELFPDYNVDCEYNGDVDRENNKKCISVLKRELREKGLLKNTAYADLEKEYTERAVFPDIIVHQRGSNERNLCIVEAKKSTSKGFEYDYLKLTAYTSNRYGNNLKYQLGVFLEIVTGEIMPDYKLTYFKDGEKIENFQ